MHSGGNITQCAMYLILHHFLSNLTPNFQLSSVHHVKSLDILLILTTVWHGVRVVTHPFIHIGPLTIFGNPHFRQDASKFAARVPFWASAFDLNIILLRFHSLEAPLLELLL